MKSHNVRSGLASQTRRLAVVAACAALALAAAQPSPLERARLAYNQQRYDEAIAAAREGERIAETASQAQLLVARALLERFRAAGDPADITAARGALAGIDSAKLTPRDRGEMQVGLAETLFFADRFGAAAELFDDALARADQPGFGPRERLLGWYATALDRQAHREEPAARRRIYRRLLDRMTVENRKGAGSAVASYWVVAATLGIDNVEAAWDAAVATWVRAPVTAGDGVALRADLDRLVLGFIIPRRARLSPAGGRMPQTADAQIADWDAVKQIWPGR
ncbi:MAG: hypothetical protein WCP29_10580 [Acidobacteriota bacterium]